MTMLYYGISNHEHLTWHGFRFLVATTINGARSSMIESTVNAAVIRIKASGSGFAPKVIFDEGAANPPYVYSQGNAQDIRVNVQNTDRAVFPAFGGVGGYFQNGNFGFGTSSPNSGLAINSSVSVKRTTVADANYTILSTDYLIVYTSLTTGRTATLPTAVSITGREYVVKDETGSAGTNNITIATTGGQTIDGAATKVINANYGVVKVYSNGANWFTHL
jgi:hypothetical protein